jgi:hypothetical protein
MTGGLLRHKQVSAYAESAFYPGGSMECLIFGYTALDAAYNHPKLRSSAGDGGNPAVNAKHPQKRNTIAKEAI